MFKIAINAGHGLNTAGKRCDKRYDPAETREWQLNQRVVNYVLEGLRDYEGWDAVRLDDPTGLRDVPLRERTDKANAFGADVYVAVHHDAGGGSGITCFSCLNPRQTTKELRQLTYDCLIASTGNRGNRAEPLREADFHEVRESKMPAVLAECGFMDHPVDTPLILTDGYARALAQGFVQMLVTRGKLPKKVLPGDVNADGKVDSTDARLVLQAEVGLVELTPEQRRAADVNADGKVDSTDARLILQKEVGLID